MEPAQGIKSVSRCAPSEVETDFPRLLLTAEEGRVDRDRSSDSGFVAGFASPHPRSSDTTVPPHNHFPLRGHSGWASARLPTYKAVKAKGAAGVDTGVLEGVACEGSVFYFLLRIELIWMRTLFLFPVIITCVG